MQNIFKILMSGFKTLIDKKISNSVSDWNQSDTSASNYVKNRTHWEEEKIQKISLLDNIEYEYTSPGDFENILIVDFLELVEGQVYQVIWDDKLYNCTAYIAELPGTPSLGNDIVGQAGGTGGNGEPFFITDYEGQCLIFTNNIGNHIVSISYTEKQNMVHKLDPKYIPADDILIQSDWLDNNETSKAFILNKPPIIQNEDGEIYVGSLDDIENATRIVTEKNFYDPKRHVVITDEVNGYNYIVAMHDGNLISYCETDYITITTQPTKTAYVNGEEFNPSGMVVIATAKDGSTREITNYKYDRVTTENINNFYIRLEEGTKVFTARVNSLKFHDFSLEDFEYIVNEDGMYELTAWKGTYNGEPNTRIVIPNSELIIV